MTREEAIKELAEMANTLQIIPKSRKGQALIMAIKALEQEPKKDDMKAFDKAESEDKE